jgi:DNA-binding response OmpR family regulator
MGASTIVVAREDLSIPGAGENSDGTGCADDVEARFFAVVRQHNPDVIVLDLTAGGRQATPAIVKIRKRTGVPILVVCSPNDPQMRDYRLAGAADCLKAPIDILELNRTVQQIIQLSKDTRVSAVDDVSQAQTVSFAGLTLHPHQNLLISAEGASVHLTTSENLVLTHFVNNPLTLCTRDNSDRAVDVIVTRLRKKMASLGGPAMQQLIKTEFRRGYIFVAEVTVGVPAAVRRDDAPLRARRTA